MSYAYIVLKTPGPGVYTVAAGREIVAIKLVGGGGAGAHAGAGPFIGGGGGGAYSYISGLTITAGTACPFQVGAGGQAGPAYGSYTPGKCTWFNGVWTNYTRAAYATCAAEGGGRQTAGGGGRASIGVGATKFSGGNAGSFGGGGGGAGGPNGAGGNGGGEVYRGGAGGGGGGGGGANGANAVGSAGGAGGNNHAGAGGGAGGSTHAVNGSNGGVSAGGGGAGYYASGGAGGNGTEIYGSAYGSGGGGGGGSTASFAPPRAGTGGAGGLWGGGGGGGGSLGGNGGHGGIILKVKTSGVPVTPVAVGQVITSGCAMIKVTGYNPGTGVYTGVVIGDLGNTIPNDPNGATFPITTGNWSVVTPVTTVGGLTHLIGKVVWAVADGLVQGPFTVSASGTITLPVPASNIIVGLLYQSQLQTLKLDTGEPTTQGKRKTIPAVTVRMNCTAGVSIGPNLEDLTPWEYFNQDLFSFQGPPVSAFGDDLPYTAPGKLVSDDLRVDITSDWTIDGYITVVQNYPLPATILAIIPEVVMGDTGK